MKKTLRININGSAFNIDEDAYNILERYLTSISSRFIDTDEGSEIITDIEIRIAELFNDIITEKSEVITINNVNNIINIMGTPADFSETNGEEDIYIDDNNIQTHKGMYRDGDSKILGGVCSGIATYIGLNPLIIRIIFTIVAFFGYGTGIGIYVLLWFIVPEAKTTAQKLAMKGERINISNIEKFIKNEFTTVKQSFEKLKKSERWENIYSSSKLIIKNISEIFGDGGRAILRIIAVIIGSILLISGLTAMSGVFTTIFFSNSIISPLRWMDASVNLFQVLYKISGSLTVITTTAASFLLIAIPLMLIAYIGIKMVFKFKASNKIIGLTSLSLWVGSIFALAIIGFTESKNFKTNSKYETSYNISSNSDTLRIELTDKNMNLAEKKSFYKLNKMKFINIEGQSKLIGKPQLSIKISENDSIKLLIQKSLRGKNSEETKENASGITYIWNGNDSIIQLNPYFNISDNNKWRDQKLKLILYIPAEKVIDLDESLKGYIHNTDNNQDIKTKQMSGKRWIMKAGGLSLWNCDKLNPDTFATINNDNNIADTLDSDINDMKEEIKAMKSTGFIFDEKDKEDEN